MKITKDEVLHVAALARLELADDVIDKFAGQIATILEYVDTLNQVDTQGVKPTSYATFRTNAFREDIKLTSLEQDAALANAPAQEDGCFKVPKIL